MQLLRSFYRIFPRGVVFRSSEFDRRAYGILDGLRDDVKENFFASLNVLERQGSRIVEVDLNILDHAVSVYYIVASAEAATNLARFDGIRYGYRSPEAYSIEDIYSISRVQGFGKEVMRRILLGNYVLSAERQSVYYKKGSAIRAKSFKLSKSL